MEQLIVTLLLPLVLGIAGSVVANRLTDQRSVTIAVGTLLFLIIAIPTLFVPPYAVEGVTWCSGDSSTQVSGHVRTWLWGSPVANQSVQVKVYEQGKGEPPTLGPITATTDEAGVFRASMIGLKARPDPGFVINVVYFWNPVLLGERWTKFDTKHGWPQSCRH
jgi:hypothetical protein